MMEKKPASVRERVEEIARAAKADQSYREAAKKLLCDVCACAAESECLDLPHVITDCIEPIDRLIVERDIALKLLELGRRFQDPAGTFDTLALLSQLSTAEAAREAAERARDEALAERDHLQTETGVQALKLAEALPEVERLRFALKSEKEMREAAVDREASLSAKLSDAEKALEQLKPPCCLGIVNCDGRHYPKEVGGCCHVREVLQSLQKVREDG